MASEPDTSLDFKRRRWKKRKDLSSHFIFLTFSLVIHVVVGKDPADIPADCISSPFEDGIDLMCSLSAINSADEKTNFSVVPHEHTLGLTVRCRQSALSSLEPDGFRSLKHLKKLTLDGCHLRSLPGRAFRGLEQLRSLTVKTRNAGILSVERDAFVGLEGLEQLDLSGNYIRYLAPEALCPLSNLRTLNLSHNEIGSLADLGSSLECLNSVKSLDLSFNEIAAISASSELQSLRSVEELRLANNYIKSIKGNVLKSSNSLRFVDLSNNRLSNLPEDLFSTAKELKRINLSNNTISRLPRNLFKSQSKSLEVLELSGNQLITLSAPLLSNLQSLTSLDLSHNELTSIDSSSALRGLSSLQSLKLGHNQLTRLPTLNLPSLRSLVLSHNNFRGRLSPSRIFSKLPVLSHLLLDNNAIEDLPKQLFMNSTKVTVLDLSHNKLKGDIPSCVSDLTSLQSFDISENFLNLWTPLSLPALWRLQASGNRLKNVTRAQLQGLSALQVLDLSKNEIDTIEKGAFDLNQPLQAIRLDENRLRRMEGLFQNLRDLSWLNVSANEIEVFDYAMVPKTLHWLDVHQNHIKVLDNYFGIEADSKIVHLDAGFNQLSEIGPQSIPNGIETFLVNDNQIASIVPYTFFKKAKLKKVDLSVNKLEKVDRNALRLASEFSSDGGSQQEQPRFYLGGNPVRCDCHMAWFKTINTLDVSGLQNFPHVADLESIYCQLVFSRDQSFVPLVDANTDDFLCSYKTHCFALCHCCDYDACDCEMTCPTNCTCYHDTTWTKNIAECSSNNFHDLPDQLPMDATEIFLDGNNIGELHSHTFIGRKNLKVLYLNNSLLTAVEKTSWQ